MKISIHLRFFLIASVVTAAVSGNVYAQQEEPIPKHLIAFTEKTLLSYGKEPVIVNSVKKQNEENLSLRQIQARDEEWTGYTGVSRFMFSLMNNECTRALYNIEEKYNFIVESFVTDNQGANVAMSHKTSDYWQGDEDKFIKCYKNGMGAIYYSDVNYDASVDENVIQVSVPVMSGKSAIGTITFTVSLDRWERR